MRALSVLILLSALPAVRADDLDKQSQKAAAAMARKFDAAGYKHVGVLKFEVRVGQRDPSLPVGRMNDVMATRLENAFTDVMARRDEAKQFGVTRAAGDQAVKADAKTTYRTDEGRAKLFEREYRLIWGEPHKVDAFVTGVMLVSPGREFVRVKYYYFDANEPATWRDGYETPDMPLTRQYLSDLGVAFVAKKGKVVARELDFGMDQPSTNPGAVQEPISADPPPIKETVTIEPPKVTAPRTEVVKEPKTPEVPVPETKILPAAAEAWVKAEKPIDFKVFYDGKEQARLPDGRSLPEPRPGQSIYFTLKSPEKVAIKLSVNGLNTADGSLDFGEDHRGGKWVLEPNREYRITGFHKDGMVEEFKAASDDEARFILPPELASSYKLGRIEVAAFTEKRPESQEATKTPNYREYVGTAASAKAVMVAINREAAIVPKSVIIQGDKQDKILAIDDFQTEDVASFRLSLTYYRPDATPKKAKD